MPVAVAFAERSLGRCGGGAIERKEVQQVLQHACMGLSFIPVDYRLMKCHALYRTTGTIAKRQQH